jgi:hypothetical protein
MPHAGTAAQGLGPVATAPCSVVNRVENVEPVATARGSDFVTNGWIVFGTKTIWTAEDAESAFHLPSYYRDGLLRPLTAFPISHKIRTARGSNRPNPSPGWELLRNLDPRLARALRVDEELNSMEAFENVACRKA